MRTRTPSHKHITREHTHTLASRPHQHAYTHTHIHSITTTTHTYQRRQHRHTSTHTIRHADSTGVSTTARPGASARCSLHTISQVTLPPMPILRQHHQPTNQSQRFLDIRKALHTRQEMFSLPPVARGDSSFDHGGRTGVRTKWCRGKCSAVLGPKA